MTDSKYVELIQRQLADYKTTVLHVQESGAWGNPARAYPHILPISLRDMNIVSPLRDEFWREQRRVGWKLHKYFHHLSSSQALAFNLLFPIYPDIPLGMVATRAALGLPMDVPCRIEFEAVLDTSEGTNIDALISVAGGSRAVVEIKLTERTFGTASADLSHLAKLEGVYKPLLRGRVADTCLEPVEFFANYQLYRNLAQIRRDSSDRVVLLLPRARTQLWKHAAEWSQRPTLASLLGRVQVVAVEDVIAALLADCRTTRRDPGAIAEVFQKYVLAVD